LDIHRADNLLEKEYKYTEDFLNGEMLDTDFFKRKSLLELLKINFNLKRNRQENTCQSSIDYSDYLVYNFIIDLAENYHGLLANKTSFNYDFADSAAMNFIKNFNLESFIKSLDEEKIENYNYIAYYYLFMSNYYSENEMYF
jgi:hypothetical protein